MSENIDFGKLCDYIRDMGTISQQDKFVILSKIAKQHTEELYQDDVKFSDDTFPQLRRDDSDQRIWQNEILDLWEEIYSYQRVLLDLIDTPRTLKMIIRDLHMAWQKLHGEVDYMELLTLTVLRNVDAPIFDFICNNIYRLRNGGNDRPKIDNADLQKIIDSLFDPLTKYERSIRKTVPVDYFARIINEYVPPEESDQAQLRTIYNWNIGSKEDAVLIDRIVNTSSQNLKFNIRWLDLITATTVEKLTNSVLFRLDEIKTAAPLQCLNYLIRMERIYERSKLDRDISNNEKMDWKWYAAILLQGLQDNDNLAKHSKFYFLTSELLFKETAALDSKYNTDTEKDELIPNDYLKLFDDTLCLMQHLSQGCEPFDNLEQWKIDITVKAANQYLIDNNRKNDETHNTY
jgi:hypothetical protein